MMFIRWIAVFCAIYLIGTICFVALFHTPIMAGIEVLMYRGIVLLILSGFVVIGLLMLIRKFIYTKINGKDIAVMWIMFSCVNMVLFTLIPVTVERSVSVFMLSYMADHREYSFSQEEIENIFDEYYVEKYGAFKKRFYEQEVTGSIEERQDSYAITERGEILVSIFRLVGKLFDTDERLLYSEE